MFVLTNGLFTASSEVNVEVGHMPVFNQLPKGIGSLKTLELPQTLDGQGILPDILLLSLELLILLVEIFLVGDGVAGTLDEIKKVVGGTITPSFVTQHFTAHHHLPVLYSNLDQISH